MTNKVTVVSGQFTVQTKDFNRDQIIDGLSVANPDSENIGRTVEVDGEFLRCHRSTAIIVEDNFTKTPDRNISEVRLKDAKTEIGRFAKSTAGTKWPLKVSYKVVVQATGGTVGLGTNLNAFMVYLGTTGPLDVAEIKLPFPAQQVLKGTDKLQLGADLTAVFPVSLELDLAAAVMTKEFKDSYQQIFPERTMTISNRIRVEISHLAFDPLCQVGNTDVFLVSR